MDFEKQPDHSVASNSGDNPHPTFRTLRNIDLNLLTIFEAVYVHNGIVNAARVLNLTPSAISQSIQKLRAIFPDPLFIRKGQGVTPTAYAAHLHEYISQGLESILGALDFQNSRDQARTLTIATQPAAGAIVLPRVLRAIQRVNPNLLLRNVPVSDGEQQLSQFQADIIIDTTQHFARSIGSHLLFEEPLVMVCRTGHPLRHDPERLLASGRTWVAIQDDPLRELRQFLDEQLPEQPIAFTSYNAQTVAAIIADSDMSGILPLSMYEIFRHSWPISAIQTSLLGSRTLETWLHFNKLSMRDQVLHDVITAVCDEFAS